MAQFEARRRKLRQSLRTAKIDALLVTNFANVSYLTGFTGDDSYLLIADDEVLVTDLRYTEQLATECPDLPLVARKAGQQMLPTLVELLSQRGFERLGVEGDSMTVGTSAALAEKLPATKIEPTDGLVERLRSIKDKGEIDAIRRAIYVAERAYTVVRAGLRPETTEFEVATELEYQIRKFGGNCLSFDALVVAGARSAMPHGQPSDQKLGDCEFALIDWGARVGQYVSDITRMVTFAKPSAKFRKMYSVIRDAHQAGIDAIKPGVTCESVDKAARDVIRKAGFGENFGHGLGHGIGMDVHEAPRLSVGQSQTKLEAGMVVTVEPGIYFAGWGGVRLEDDVLVTRTGSEVLTSLPKEIDDCVIG